MMRRPSEQRIMNQTTSPTVIVRCVKNSLELEVNDLFGASLSHIKVVGVGTR